MMPKRRKHALMRVQAPSVVRCPSHLKWVRGHECAAVGSGGCGGRIEAAHVRRGTDGGVGMKPGDCFTLPLCSEHHRRQHQIGEAPFEKETGVNMKSTADALWNASPHGRRYRAEHLPSGA